MASRATVSVTSVFGTASGCTLCSDQGTDKPYVRTSEVQFLVCSSVAFQSPCPFSLVLDLLTHVMMETVSYYNANGSNIYALMLDVSKAFVKVNCVNVFKA